MSENWSDHAPATREDLVVTALVIAYDVDLRVDISEGLADRSFETRTAEDAETGATLASVLQPDVIVLDWSLPGDAGVPACRRVRDAAPGAAVVMLTDSGDLRDRHAALEAGAREVLRKPVSVDELAYELRRARGTKRFARRRPSLEAVPDLPGIIEAPDEHERLRLVIDTTHDPYVATDEHGVIEDWNPAAEVLFGWRRDEAIGRRLSETIIPPDVREAHDLERNRFATDGESDLVGRRVDIRAMRRDGRELLVELSMVPLKVGERLTFSAFFRDVSEVRRSDAARGRLAAVVASTDDAIVTQSANGVVTSWNAGAERLYGIGMGDAVGRRLEDLVRPESPEDDAAVYASALRGERVRSYDTRHRRRDGALVDVCCTVSPVRDREGAVVEASLIARDVTERRTAERAREQYAAELEELAHRDAVTGLLGEPDFHATLQRALGGDGDPRCGVLAVAVDDLQALNDKRGRAAGDRLLRQVANVLRDACASDAVACRTGGDELAVVLPGAQPDDVESLANCVREAWLVERPAVTLTMAAVASPGDGATPEELWQRARKLLGEGRSVDIAKADAALEALAVRGDTGTADRIVGLLRRHVGSDLAFASEFVGDREVVRFADAAMGVDAPAVGDEAPDSRPGDALKVPIRLPRGRVFGALTTQRCAEGTGGAAAVQFAGVCARVLGDLVEQQELEAENRRLHGELTGVRALLAALDARDRYTGDHSEAVVELAGVVARHLGLDSEVVATVEQAALLHDIGKLGIPDAILHKQGPLDETEWEVMREHPAIGEKIITTIPSLTHLAPTIRAEHERWDGRGYPDGLAGQDIPLGARVVLACDAYHAMTSDRPYRKSLGPKGACRELEQNAGTQFDPQVVGALLQAVG